MRTVVSAVGPAVFLATTFALVSAAQEKPDGGSKPDEGGSEGENGSEARERRDDLSRRRAKSQEIYNGAFIGSMLQGPEEAETGLEEAQRRMEEANPADSGDRYVGMLIFQRGYLATEAGEHEKAIALFEELVRRFPRHAYADDALFQVGYVCQRRLRDYDRATEAYTRLASMYADRENAGPALWNKAQIAVQRNDIARANDLLNQARESNVSNRLRRGQKYTPNYYEEQSDRMLEFIARNTDETGETEPVALIFQARDNMQSDRPAEAESQFRRIRDRYSRSKLVDDAAFGIAECRRLSGRFDEAAAAYRSFLVEFPQSDLAPRAKFRLAGFVALAGREDEARRLYEAVVADVDRVEAAARRAGRKRPVPSELGRARVLARRRLEELTGRPAIR